MMQLDYPHEFLEISRRSTERMQSFRSSSSLDGMHDFRLRVDRLSRGAIILPTDLNIPEPEEEISFGMNAPQAQQVKVTVEDLAMFMRVNPEINEETAHYLAMRKVWYDNRQLRLTLCKPDCQEITATAQHLMRFG